MSEQSTEPQDGALLRGWMTNPLGARLKLINPIGMAWDNLPRGYAQGLGVWEARDEWGAHILVSASGLRQAGFVYDDQPSKVEER